MQRVLARVLVLGVASLLGVVLAEIVVRVAAPQVTMWPRYVTSSEYPIEMATDATIRHRRGGHWEFVYTTNAIGRRGPLHDPSEIQGDAVVLLGDSFTFGVGVQDDEVYAARLQEACGVGWTVINGGMSGWGIDSQIKWFYAVGAEYDPAAVVLQFTANDPWDSGTGVTTVEDSGFAFHSYSVDKPAWQEWLSGSGVLQSSHLFSLLRALEAARGGRGGTVADPETARAAATVLQDVQDRYVRYLDAFAAELASQGTRLLFVSVTHPTRDGYVYDLGNYPLIEDAVRRLQAEELLEWVALPMQRMEAAQISDEGHQWGADHHAYVGEALAGVLLGAGE